MMENKKIYYCATHKKYEIGKLPCGDVTKKPYCRFRFTKKIADETGQLKIFHTYIHKI